MKILLFARDLATGGSQRQLALLAAGLARRGHDVAVAVLYNGGTLELTLNNGDVRILPIGKLGRWHVAAPLARLRRIFVSERPDLVYAFLPIQTTLAALLLPRKLGTKLVFGLRAGDMQLDHYGALEAFSYRSETLLGARADLIIANALAVRAAAVARGIPEERIAVVPNGFDTEAMRPDSAAGRAQRHAWGIPSDRFVIGCIARLDPMKDHATFINAAAQFAQSNPDAYFVCVGEGGASYREKLKQLAQSSCLNDRLFWAGEVADMKAAYNAFDIVTLSSAFGEGFPNVLGEAMACGVPVAATDVGDARLIVDEFGEVSPAGNAHLLCAGWTRLRGRLAREKSLPAAARQFVVENFGVDTMVSRTETVLFALLAGRATKDITAEFSWAAT